MTGRAWKMDRSSLIDTLRERRTSLKALAFTPNVAAAAVVANNVRNAKRLN